MTLTARTRVPVVVAGSVVTRSSANRLRNKGPHWGGPVAGGKAGQSVVVERGHIRRQPPQQHRAPDSTVIARMSGPVSPSRHSATVNANALVIAAVSRMSTTLKIIDPSGRWYPTDQLGQPRELRVPGNVQLVVRTDIRTLVASSAGHTALASVTASSTAKSASRTGGAARRGYGCGPQRSGCRLVGGRR